MKVLVRAKCIQCGATRDIGAGEIPPGEMPSCLKCGNIMIATESIIADPEPPSKESPYPSPFVMCGDHKLRRGYIVCVHVAAGASPEYVKLSKGKSAGEIVCSGDFKHDKVEHFILICEGCAIERGWVTAVECSERDAREERKATVTKRR